MIIGVLVSGQLGFSILKKIHLKHEVGFVMSDKKSTSIINFCNENNVNLFLGNPRNGKSLEFIKDRKIDVLVSVNYLFLIEKELISLPKKLAFNIHGSLLPKYRGRTPHVWAIINNEKETGITAHEIDSGCDTGRIIEQIKLPIEYLDTGASILLKFEDLYEQLVNRVLEKIENNNYVLQEQDETVATYYGKRTPEDGKINWDWQKERIRNWVRAQASPYPGAFSFLDNEKIIIDTVEFHNKGFHYSTRNGEIIATNPLIVKTGNGALQLKEIRPTNVTFEKGKIFK